MTDKKDNIYKLFPNEPSAIELFDAHEDSEEEDQSIRDIEAINKIREDSQIQTLAMVLISEIGTRLAELGMEPNDTPEDFSFAAEAIISYISAHYEREHPLQQIAAATISLVSDEDEKMVYRFHPPSMSFLRSDKKEIPDDTC